MQNKFLYSINNTSSPTVSTDSFLLLLSVYANKEFKINTIDIVSAYLNCNIEKEVYMILDSLMSSLLVKIDPHTYSKYNDRDKKRRCTA
jgi:Reverse transcriptase (RNA-dependent DNA polymerase)